MSAHRNRDFFARPNQSDRLYQDYGNTRLSTAPEPPHPSDGRSYAGVVVVVAVALVAMAMAVML